MAVYTEFSKVINYLAEEMHRNAVEHGFYEDYNQLESFLAVSDKPNMLDTAKRNFILSQLSKIASEVGEAVAVVQKQRTMNDLPEELADIVIRTFDLAGFMNYNFGAAVIDKMNKNLNRPYKHGKIC